MVILLQENATRMQQIVLLDILVILFLICVSYQQTVKQWALTTTLKIRQKPVFKSVFSQITEIPNIGNVFQLATKPHLVRTRPVYVF
jgi:hypothetical protein